MKRKKGVEELLAEMETIELTKKNKKKKVTKAIDEWFRRKIAELKLREKDTKSECVYEWERERENFRKNDGCFGDDARMYERK